MAFERKQLKAFERKHKARLNSIPPPPHMKKKKRAKPQRPLCTVRQEYECAMNVTINFPLVDNHECPEDCEDVSFSSVIFGGRLNPNDIESLLPSDWDDIKERKVDYFQRALELIPKDRIPVVRSVQQLSNEAKQFIDLATKIFGVIPPNSSLVPCLNENGTKRMEKTRNQLFVNERIWRNVESYLQLVFPHNLEDVFAVMGLHLSTNFTLEYLPETQYYKHDLLDKAIFHLQRIEESIRDPSTIFGIKSMDHHERSIFVHFVFAEYESIVMKITSSLQRVKFTTKPKIFKWKDHQIDLREFEILYREGGKDQMEMNELMKLRKIIHFDLAEVITSSTMALDKLLASRQSFIDHLGIAEGATEQIHQFHQMQRCMREIIPKLQQLRRLPFIRVEWMSRLERLVEQAQAYSPGIQYDRVNLLHIKLYYAHFKQEIIRQERSYNIFLLLAEIGGTIGLYVGATLLTAAETFVFFIEKRTRRLIIKPQFC